MIFWMAKAARSISGELRSQIDKAAEGARWSLAVVALLAVGREGLETALFLWAATQASTSVGNSSATPDDRRCTRTARSPSSSAI